MRAVLQRVRNARVEVDESVVGAIEHGWLVLLGIDTTDTASDVAYLADKTFVLRAFADETGKPNRSVTDVGGSVLVVSQFTLLADCHSGRRPSYIQAARPEQAMPLYELFMASLKERGLRVESGRFGAAMQVYMQGDGPITLLLDSRKRF